MLGRILGQLNPLQNRVTRLIKMVGASIIDANSSIAAHATTMDPWSLGNYVTLTGTAVTFTGMANAPQAGAEVELYMNAAHVFTDGAVFEVDGDANYTATIGDRVLLRAKSTTVITVHPRKKDGTAVVQPTSSKLIQRSVTTYSTYSSTALNVPYDNTIPTTSEGLNIFDAAAFTPTLAANIVRLTWLAVLGASAAGHVFAYIVKDAATDALCVAMDHESSSGTVRTVTGVFEETGSAAARAYNFYIGSQNGTTYVNGDSGGALMGGLLKCYLIIEEFTP